MAKKKRPDVLRGSTEKIKTGCGNLFLTINEHEEEPYEISARIGKSGSCVRSMLEVIGILLSIIFQNCEKDVIKKTVNHLLSVSCGQEFREGDARRMSCLDVIAERVKKLEKEVGE